ncbi:YbaB/EbfC family nucleoid-associated protein [Simkania negevensis]|uniref:YbaB/EbfC family nucleoid-associated protein n=1 Tax=Simkania negevensis TaxID=83561 RepID=A0ABS3ARQ0_9BACT|nr:YbaB/EbfC family nucleoid-associated protein [Simkania negevensis]
MMEMGDLLKEMGEIVNKTNVIQQKMTDTMDQFNKQTFSAQSTNKKVKVKLDHDLIPIAIEIDDSLLTPKSKEALTKSLLEALRKGVEQGRKNFEEKMSGIVEEMQTPAP